MEEALIAMALLIAGIVTIIAGILIIMGSLRMRKGYEGDSRAYGLILLGPLPILLRSRDAGGWLLTFLVLISMIIVLAVILALLL